MADSGGLVSAWAELLPGLTVALRNPLIHLNAEEAGDGVFARRVQYWFAARDFEQPPVRLGRFPAETRLDGETYGVVPDGAAAPPGLDEAAHRRWAWRAAHPVEVRPPCLLVCRTGEWCWGHWLLDMLPKIVLAERCFPGRLLYAVPAGIIDVRDKRAHAPDYARSVLGSLAAYGIGPDRLLGIRHDVAYRFAGLFDMDGAGGKHLHPGLLAAMRDLPIMRQGGGTARLTAVLRAPPSIRPLANLAEIRACLDREGAGFLDPLQASFVNQVAAFANSETLVGDLGSNLAAAIYARPGARLVTLAPLRWDDDYFAKLFQRLDLTLADIRGFSAGQGLAEVATTPHYVPPQSVLRGLAASLAGVADAVQTVSGRPVARAPGAVLLRVDFRAGGNAASFRKQGFASPERAGTWSIGTGCQVFLPRPENAPGGFWVEIEGLYPVSPLHPAARPLGISVNGVHRLDSVVGGTTILHIPVSADLASASETLTLAFAHACCPSPESLGVSADTRRLGLFFQAISLREMADAHR